MTMLTVELVPETCWWSNVRSNVSVEEWERCKRYVRSRSKDRCEVCGGRGKKWPVECHEVWVYDHNYMENTNRQVLIDLIALCPDCHMVKHIGLAEIQGKRDQALAHLARVNGWSIEEAESYVALAADLWRARSEYEWELDVTFLSFLGIKAEVKDR